MRISDWVQTCALPILLHPGAAIGPHRIAHDEVYYVLRRGRGGLRRRATGLEPGIGRLSVRRRGRRDHAAGRAPADADHRLSAAQRLEPDSAMLRHRPTPPSGHRSEEHTSELQSLMRISYAVFCLKKKKPNTRTNS